MLRYTDRKLSNDTGEQLCAYSIYLQAVQCDLCDCRQAAEGVQGVLGQMGDSGTPGIEKAAWHF